MGRDIVHLHGAIPPLGGYIDLPLIPFVHPGKDDLPAHDEVSDQEQRRKRLPFRRVEDGPVDKTAGVVDIDDAPVRRLLGAMTFFQHPIQDAVVQDHNPFFLGFYLKERLVRLFVWIRPFISSALHDRY